MINADSRRSNSRRWRKFRPRSSGLPTSTTLAHGALKRLLLADRSLSLMTALIRPLVGQPIPLERAWIKTKKESRSLGLWPGGLRLVCLYRTSVFRPFLHHCTTLLKKIGSEVRRFRLVLPIMRQCLLTDLARITRRLR